MAELILKVGDHVGDTAYKDGDILCAFNDCRIHCVHAQHICHPDKMSFNSAGLRDADNLLDVYLKNTYQYKFQRVSDHEIKRILLLDMSEEIIGAIPNSKGEYMAVMSFIARRKKHARHRIFGTDGAEFWYGGRTTITDAINTTIWDEIESRTTKLKADHSLWPLTDNEKKSHFAITVDDFDNAEAGLLVAPEVDNADPDNPVMVKKRSRNVDWEVLDSMSTDTISKLRDPSKLHDSRDKFSYVRATEVKAKV